MKIGIVTFHRAHNYGAVLQCYALQTILEVLGFESFVIDYRQKTIEENYKTFSWKKFVTKLPHPIPIWNYLKSAIERRNRGVLFKQFVEKYLKTIPFDNKIPEEMDVVMIGSDQLWSVNITGGYDLFYFGDIPRKSKQKIVSYAISSNVLSIKGLSNEQLLHFLSNFHKLSFREKNIAELVECITGRKSEICIDPVLLTTADMWCGLINKSWANRKYILLYQVQPINNDFEKAENVARKIAEDRACELIDLTKVRYSPENFVSLFYYASFIVTTSFHGTAFSVLFHKPFVTLHVNEIVDERANNLLSQVGLPDRMIYYNDKFVDKPIDFCSVDDCLNVVRNKSINYIKGLEQL